ncbi:MAG: STM4014 family protein [Planctomycetota bacterium]
MRDSQRDHWILGDSTGRRVADYKLAAQSMGMPTPKCIDWIELIQGGVSVLDRLPTDCRLRIDSFGERDDVLAGLICLGGGVVTPLRGEIKSLDYQHAGLCKLLSSLSQWRSNRGDVVFDQAPGDIATMFDKWETHKRVLSHRPRTFLVSHEGDRPLTSLPEDVWGLIEKIAGNFAGRVFIKPRYASSASGVCCLRVSRNQYQLIAPIELARIAGSPQLFNSLQMRCFTRLDDIHDILRVLLPQGMIVEEAINKARVDGDRFDLRIVVIGGHADHVVVRQSPWPITNLHLGNQRGSIDAVARAVGPKKLDACRELAIHVANQFPESLYCGVDVLLPRNGEPLVCEANAFGDFLPRIFANGRSVYQAILEAGQRRTGALRAEALA